MHTVEVEIQTIGTIVSCRHIRDRSASLRDHGRISDRKTYYRKLNWLSLATDAVESEGLACRMIDTVETQSGL